MAYNKYVYWLGKDVEQVREALDDSGRHTIEVTKAVCLPLSSKYEVGLVPPSAWSNYELCRRQFSWYHQSHKSGLTLIVSSDDLIDIGLTPEVIITCRPDFQPPRRPEEADLHRLLERDAYRQNRPEAWEDLSAETPGKLNLWLKLLGLSGRSFEDLLLYHSANHANFLDPLFTVTENNVSIPYSIQNTKNVCSACLEFYNIIGVQHEKKLVTPCPGAVLFTDLQVNTYYEVSGSGFQTPAPARPACRTGN